MSEHTPRIAPIMPIDRNGAIIHQRDICRIYGRTAEALLIVQAIVINVADWTKPQAHAYFTWDDETFIIQTNRVQLEAVWCGDHHRHQQTNEKVVLSNGILWKEGE